MLDRHEILDRIERLLVEPGIDRVRDGNDQKRVAVGRRFCGEIGADHAAGAAAVVDKDLLAEFFAELVGDDAPDHVVAAAGRERDDQADRAARIIVRGRCRRGEQRQRKREEKRAERNRAKSRHQCLPNPAVPAFFIPIRRSRHCDAMSLLSHVLHFLRLGGAGAQAGSRDRCRSRHSARPCARIRPRGRRAWQSRRRRRCLPCLRQAAMRLGVGLAHPRMLVLAGQPQSASRSLVPISTMSTPSTAMISSALSIAARALELHDDHGGGIERRIGLRARGTSGIADAAGCRRWSARRAAEISPPCT